MLKNLLKTIRPIFILPKPEVENRNLFFKLVKLVNLLHFVSSRVMIQTKFYLKYVLLITFTLYSYPYINCKMQRRNIKLSRPSACPPRARRVPAACSRIAASTNVPHFRVLELGSLLSTSEFICETSDAQFGRHV